MIYLLMLVALLLGLGLYNARVVRAIEAKLPPSAHFVAVDGVRLHYISKGTGQPVLFIHGNDGLLQEFSLTVLDQVASEFQALVFDRPGHGYSDRPAGEQPSLALNARLLHEAAQKLGIARPVLVAHSYGGSVALRYALDYPADVAGLVLLAPGAFTKGLPAASPVLKLPGVPLLGPILINTLLASLGRAMAPGMYAPSFAPHPVPDSYIPQARFSLRPGQFAALAGESLSFAHDVRAMEQRYGEIAVPVAILAGDADRVSQPEEQAVRLHNAIPQSTLVMLGGTSHMVHQEHPAAVIAAIRQIAGK